MFNAVSKTGCNKKGGNEMNIPKQKDINGEKWKIDELLSNEKLFEWMILSWIDYYIYEA